MAPQGTIARRIEWALMAANVAVGAWLMWAGTEAARAVAGG